MEIKERVAILDCGGQYTKVIDRKVREAGVYTDILPMGVPCEKLRGYDAIILSGGPSSVWADNAPEYDSAIFELGVPMLGICYGMQLICEHFGGSVIPELKTEYGTIAVECDVSCPLFDSLTERQTVLMSHGDAVKKVPETFRAVAKTGEVTAAVWSADKRIAGVQFHPEVELTENGIAMLENFLRKICMLKDTYALDDRIKTSIEMIRRRVGEKKVIVLVSGGVDSAVTAALLVKALPPENVYAIHVDHGLMRKDESDIVCRSLSDLGLVNMLRVNAEDRFFGEKTDIGDGVIAGPLCCECDPEKKRKIIGSMFIKVTYDAAATLGLDIDNTFIAQGTLRPDLIESGNPDVSGYANKIKTHHNDVDIVRRARERGMIIETNWDWHKDEVRRVARTLGLDESVASRQPFPGPGLGVRMICCDGAIGMSDTDKISEIAEYVNNEGAGRYSVYLGPIQSVGVQGDNRSYKTLATLYKNAFGEVKPEACDWDTIFALAKGIPNRFDFVNRVAFCLYGEIDGPVTCAGLHIKHETAELLRDIDSCVTANIMNPKIAQCFAVLFPMGCASEQEKKYSCAIRAVCTSDFMTARSAVPGVDFEFSALENTVRDIIAVAGNRISMIFYDVTGKPPATVEWE